MTVEQFMLNTIQPINYFEGLKKIDGEMVDLTVTFPPFNFDFESTAQELYRITKKGGVVVWIPEDKFENGCWMLKPKKQVFYLTDEVGFWLHDTMLYVKNPTYFNTPREPDRFIHVTQFMFILSKGKPKTTNLIRDRKNNMYNYQKYYTSFRNRKRDGSIVERKVKKRIKKCGVRYNIWDYSDSALMHDGDAPKNRTEHLFYDHVKSWSNKNDIVLDPFDRDGAIGRVCGELKREYIGFRIQD